MSGILLERGRWSKEGLRWCGWDSWWVPSGEDGNGTGSYGPFHWSDRVRAVFDDGA